MLRWISLEAFEDTTGKTRGASFIMWKEKLNGSRERFEGAVKTTQPNGYRCYLTAEELEFLDTEKVSAKVAEVNMPMRQAQPLISGANRLRGSVQTSRVEGYECYVPVPPNRPIDLTVMSGIMVLGGFSVSDSPEYGSPAMDEITA